MKNPDSSTRSRSDRRDPAFALIITLTLMVLLSILSLGLLLLSSIELRRASADIPQQLARANARLALLLAVGELQTSLGPDARVSARAETLGNDPRAGGSAAANTPQAWWVGVSHSDGLTKLSNDTLDIIWLVSGTDGGPDKAPRNPVKMIGEGSLDLATFTGGRDIEAGRVEISNDSGSLPGAYAWFIDDNGMKAQLKASHPDVRNDHPANFSEGVLAASFHPAVLDQLSAIGAASPDEIQRLGSVRDLQLLGATKDVARNKFFSYTTQSLGVLADVKNGRLKKDLSVPFDWQPNNNAASNPVFDRLFPRTDPSNFIVADHQRLASELSELNRENGYINFAIFRDYYRLKDHLREVSGVNSLWITTFHKAGLLGGRADGVYNGAFAPHSQSSWNTATHPQHAGLPYGNYGVFRDSAIYRDNPITPILSSLQQNAWVTDQGGEPAKIRTHVQMFTSHYNAYNVGLILSGDNPSHTGPRVMSYPQVRFTVSGTTLDNSAGLDPKLQAHARGGLVIQPGRSQVLGFRSSALRGGEIDQQLYSPNVAALTTQSVYNDTDGTLSADSKLTAHFVLNRGNIMHGMDHQSGDHEVGQVIYAPFSWDSTGSHPARTVTTQGTGLNHVARNAFYLRTTREPGNAIRPLIDANIRAMWNNPRWDSPLGLNMLASHSETSHVSPSGNLPPMSTTINGHGFTYLGADRDPSGYDRVILFDVPRADLVSLGQLQHASAGRFSYEPTYIVGNSYANLRIPLDSVRATVSDSFSPPRGLPSAGSFNLYDASYIVNERLWDEYIFTTIPQSGAGPSLSPGYCATLLARSSFLPNARFIPYEPPGSTFSPATLSDPGTGDGTTGTGSFFHNAGHLLVDGSFNINSTSVDAWEAFLTGTHGLPVGRSTTNGTLDGFSKVDGVRFPRAASHLGEAMKTASMDENYWIGFRELTQTEVRDIATEIVGQIRQRGPFLSLGSFINRKLENSEQGKSGPLQAALDNTVNRDLDGSFESSAGNHPNIAANSSQGAGFPGQLLQGDILQALSPYMTVRSDTFTIRGYGEARDPVSGDITATAYCEAVVQRFPDPVVPATGSKTALEELAAPSSDFGRKFFIVSFRWLAPGEI